VEMCLCTATPMYIPSSYATIHLIWSLFYVLLVHSYLLCLRA
jgi:hypothetical protein